MDNWKKLVFRTRVLTRAFSPSRRHSQETASLYSLIIPDKKSGQRRIQDQNFTLESLVTFEDFQGAARGFRPPSPSKVETPVHSKRHRISCGSFSAGASGSGNEESSGTKIIRSCSTGFTNGPELQKPVGRYHQQQHSVQDTSVLASAVRVAATIGLSVSHTGPGEPTGVDISPTMSQSSDLPYILRSVTGERRDVRPGAPSEPNEYNFNFKKRGLFLLINNRHFEEETGQQSRDGSDVDAERLEERFQDLGFEVRRYDDVTCSKMTSLLHDAASYDHSDHDCFGCAILSHGREGIVYARDGHVTLDLLVLPFKGDRCPSLIGKPKLFFIQACETRRPSAYLETSSSRGRSPVSPSSSRRSPMSSSLTGDEDSEFSSGTVPMRKIPIEADCLFCYSTVPGYYSWRNNQDGSWFIQALCIVLENYGTRMELTHMLTHVNRIVAYEFASCSDKEFGEAMKQLPCMVSMLTRYVYFRPKKQDIR